MNMNEFWKARHEQIKASGKAGSMAGKINKNLLNFFEHISEELKSIKTKTIIDFGCSVGNMAKFLKMFFQADKYVGIDIIDFVIKENKKKFPKDYEFKLFPCNINKAGVIWSSFLFQHFEDIEFINTLNILKKSLTEKGKIYITDTTGTGKNSNGFYWRTIKQHELLFKLCELKYDIEFKYNINGFDVYCYGVYK